MKDLPSAKKQTNSYKKFDKIRFFYQIKIKFSLSNETFGKNSSAGAWRTDEPELIF